MNFILGLTLVLSIASLVYSALAYRHVRRVMSILESRQCATVTIDHTDGRITVLQRQYDTDLQRPSV